MAQTMCDLAHSLPLLIGTLLDQEAKLKRGRFREETMTDVLTGALAAFAGPNLVVQYPPETVTGGDLDLQFWHVASNRELRVRLQAKRLNAAVNGLHPVKPQHRSYNELLHKPPSATNYQFETLRDTPPPWLPLYIFYNHGAVTIDPFFKAKKPKISGINLAFAIDVATELKAKVDAASQTPRKIRHHKRLSHLHKHFFELDALFCPSGDWQGESVPTPNLVSASLRERYMVWGERTVRPKKEDGALRKLFEPNELLASDYQLRIASGPAVRFYTRWEVNMLQIAAALTREETGWLRQTPGITSRLKPLKGLVTAEDVQRAATDWDGACIDRDRHANEPQEKVGLELGELSLKLGLSDHLGGARHARHLACGLYHHLHLRIGEAGRPAALGYGEGVRQHGAHLPLVIARTLRRAALRQTGPLGLADVRRSYRYPAERTVATKLADRFGAAIDVGRTSAATQTWLDRAVSARRSARAPVWASTTGERPA